VTKHFKPRKGKRKWDDPDLAWKTKDHEMRIFLLEPKEWVETKTSTSYEHTFQGPGVVTLTLDRGHSIWERHASDPSFWSWIARLIEPSVIAYGGELLTKPDRPCDITLEEWQRVHDELASRER